MKKINHKILSLPPYISTSWKNINTLHMKEVEGRPSLIILLHNGSTIEIPNIEKSVIEQVFEAHGKFLEEQESTSQISDSLKQFEAPEPPFSFSIPFQVGGGTEALDNFGALFQHNSEQADAPELPKEMIQKIATITKSLGMDLEQMNILKAEPHCNCPYCQISRVVHAGAPTEGTNDEEEISDDDLQFRDWEIKQKDEHLYDVINPLDQNEHYQVYLGSPVGCTCGQKNCEHIRSVLSS